MILLVTYDLHDPGRNYPKVEKALKAAHSYVHPLGSVWLLDSTDKPSIWRDRLKAAGDSTDEFFVVQIREHWASSQMDKEAAAWLKSGERRW